MKNLFLTLLFVAGMLSSAIFADSTEDAIFYDTETDTFASGEIVETEGETDIYIYGEDESGDHVYVYDE